MRKLVAYFAAAVIATTGLAVTSAAPALAIGGCRTMAGDFIRVCFNYSGGSNAQADFYLLRQPDFSQYYYRVWIVVNNTEYAKTPTPTRFGALGRHCCWYQHVDDLPNSYKTAFTRVRMYRFDGAQHQTADSPSFSFWS